MNPNHGSRCYNFGMGKLLFILLLLLPINAFSLSREEAKQKLSSDPAWIGMNFTRHCTTVIGLFIIANDKLAIAA